MKFTIDKDTFQKAIAGVQGVVDRRGIKPILSHVLLTPNETGLNVSGTDLELYYRGHASAQVTEGGGGITVSAAKLFGLLKELPPGEIEGHTTDKNNLVLKKGESKYTLHGLPSDQYPEFPEPRGEAVEVESKVLKEVISKVAFSMAGDDLQYNLTSMLLEQGEGKPLRLVSTDGHRLTLIDRDTVNLSTEPILVPAKGAREIMRFLEGEKVQVGISERNFFVQDGSRQLSIRLLDRKFPEYERIIPDGWKHSFTFSRQGMIEAIKRLTILSSERFRMVLFELQEDRVQLTFESPEEGQGVESLPILRYEHHEIEGEEKPGFPLQIGLNARYLLEPLQAMGGEEVNLEVNDCNRPCRLVSPEDPQYFSLVMPVDL